MTAVEDAVRMVLALPTEQVREVTIKLAEALANAPPQWPANLHPAWKDEIARRDATPEDDDIAWEQVERDMQEAIDEVNRERDASGES